MTPIPIEGIIGLDITPANVRAQLAGAGDIEIQVHSPGGFLHDGIAIHNLLLDHRRAGHRVTARITSLAASAASYVLLAAESISAAANATVMIHNPHMIALGDHRALAKSAQLLAAAAGLMAEGYAARLGVEQDAARALMDAETWWHGQEIVDAGLAQALESPVADEPTGRKQAVARGQLAVTAMLESVKSHPEPLDRLAALLPTPERPPMSHATPPNTTQAIEAERARLLGILELPEARERQAAALALAKTPGMTPEAAAAVLAAVPVPKPAGGLSAFEKHMAALGNPPIGDDDDSRPPAPDPAAWSLLRSTR